MALMKWRPSRNWLSLRDEMDRFFDDFFGSDLDRFPAGFETKWMPSADLLETDNELVAKVELPGMDKKDINISVQDNVLMIRGTKTQEKEDKNENYHRIERSFGSFQKSLNLPVPVDVKKVKASYKNGVLKVTLPKVPEAKAKEIPITVE